MCWFDIILLSLSPPANSLAHVAELLVSEDFLSKHLKTIEANPH